MMSVGLNFPRFLFSLGWAELVRFERSLLQRSESIQFLVMYFSWIHEPQPTHTMAYHGCFELTKNNLLIQQFLTQLFCFQQLILRSEMRYFSKGSFIADSREEAKMLMVITSGQVANKA